MAKKDWLYETTLQKDKRRQIEKIVRKHIRENTDIKDRTGNFLAEIFLNKFEELHYALIVFVEEMRKNPEPQPEVEEIKETMDLF